MEIQEGKIYHLIEEKRETLVQINRILPEKFNEQWEIWASAYVLADTVGIGIDGRIRALTVKKLKSFIDHEVGMKDLPLYISWPHTTPKLSELLKI